MTGTADLIARAARLEMTARRNVTGLLQGRYTTVIRGRGLSFHEARKYVPGEDIRLIDWNMTARCQEPYVRVHLDEREREVFIALDVSPSMRTGWQDQTKLEYAVELAASIAVSAIEARDRLGYVLFQEDVTAFSPPKRGQAQLFRTVRAMLHELDRPAGPVAETDPRTAIHAIQRLRGRRFVVFMISDFIDHDLHDDFRYIQARHDVSLLHIYDPVEFASSSAVRFQASSPEGGRLTAAIRPGMTGSLDRKTDFLKSQSREYGLFYRSFSTREPAGPALREFFQTKKRVTA